MEIRLRTLTPIHVGDGSSLHSFDYAIHNGRFFRTSRRFFESFLEKIKATDEKITDKFVEWAGDLTSKMDELEGQIRQNPRAGRDFNQRLSDLRRNFNLREFSKKVGQEKAFVDFLTEQKAPSLPIFTADDRIQEIRGFQRDADERIYLPGSSVKGCIRTALFYHFLETNADHVEVRQILQTNLKKVKDDRAEAEKRRFRFSPERHRRQFGEELENLAFRAGMVGERGGPPKFTEAQDDLMKCLLVSDVEVPPDGVGIEKIDLYLVKKLPDAKGFEAQRQRQAPAVEAIQPDQTLLVKLDINLELLLFLHRKDETANDDGLRVGREKHFIGWREKTKTLFGLTSADFKTIPPKAAFDSEPMTALREKAIKHILECCRKFSNAQAAAFLKWQKEEFCNPQHNAGSMARDLEKGSARVLQAKGARLHLGFATGFEGMTVVLHLLANHKKLFGEIMDAFGIGDSPSAWKNRRPGEGYHANPDKFPKSRRLVTRPGLILPMGWMEWADDPLAVALPTQAATVSSESEPTAPIGPRFPKGVIRQGLEVDAEIMVCGSPNKIRLFLSEAHQPIVDLKYGLGFSPEKVGQFIQVKLSGVKGSGEVVSVQFVKFK